MGRINGFLFRFHRSTQTRLVSGYYDKYPTESQNSAHLLAAPTNNDDFEDLRHICYFHTAKAGFYDGYAGPAHAARVAHAVPVVAKVTGVTAAPLASVVPVDAKALMTHSITYEPRSYAVSVMSNGAVVTVLFAYGTYACEPPIKIL